MTTIFRGGWRRHPFLEMTTIFRGGWRHHPPWKWPLLNALNFRTRQTLQSGYKVCIHPRSYEKVINFLGETNCKGGSHHRPLLKIIFRDGWCQHPHLEMTTIFISLVKIWLETNLIRYVIKNRGNIHVQNGLQHSLDLIILSANIIIYIFTREFLCFKTQPMVSLLLTSNSGVLSATTSTARKN